ncbi:hypothetical protein [Tumidithrix helvetica]|uniref:hypothetical protein n=1 Tax=Tumidithrix helvetica TaxID=3457545 RepID=UPI003CC6BB46
MSLLSNSVYKLQIPLLTFLQWLTVAITVAIVVSFSEAAIAPVANPERSGSPLIVIGEDAAWEKFAAMPQPE